MSYRILIGGRSLEDFSGLTEAVLRDDGTLESLTEIKGVRNPTFLAYHAPSSRIFALGQRDGAAELCMISHDGAENPVVSRIPAPGGALCHAAVNSKATLVSGASFSGGDAALFSCDEHGFLKQAFHKNYNAPGVISHPHCILPSPDDRWFYLVDLGRDRLECYDCTGSIPCEHGGLSLKEGDGPRQLLFHPTAPTAWLVTEYSNVVYTLGYNAETGEMTVLQRLSTIPDSFTGITYGASLAYSASASTLYASNRGMDSLAMYSVAADGQISEKGFVSCYGKWPRHIGITKDNRFLLMCSEHTSELCILPIDADGVPGEPVARIEHNGCTYAADVTEK